MTNNNSFPLTFNATFKTDVAGVPSEALTVSESSAAVDAPASVPVPAESVTVSEPTITTDLYSSTFPLTFDEAFGSVSTAAADSEAATIDEPTITADAPASVPAPSEGLTLTESSVASVTPAPPAPSIPAATVTLSESGATASGSATTASAASEALELSESPVANVTPARGRIRPPAARLQLAEPAVWAFGGAIPTLTRWLLKTIYREWPDESRPPPPPDEDAAVRIDRDDPEVLATGERSLSFDLTVGATISAGIDDSSHTPEGTSPTYETEETATIRVTSLHERQGGTVAGHADHRRLVDSVLQALDVARSYPDVVLADRARQPARLSLFLGSVEHTSNSHSDHYETNIPVRLRGKLDPYQ